MEIQLVVQSRLDWYRFVNTDDTKNSKSDCPCSNSDNKNNNENSQAQAETMITVKTTKAVTVVTAMPAVAMK